MTKTTEKQSEQPAVREREITSQVLSKVNAFVNAGELKIPSDYSPENALKGAMLILNELKDRDKKPVLESCSKNSIAQSLLKMVVEGLSPLKKQGYFIPYGGSLEWSRSYQGSIALAKRVGNVSDVVANVIYNEDEFEFSVDVETGYKRILKHVQRIENIDNSKIKGAYAVVIYTDGRKDLEVMTFNEIQQAWKQGATKGTSGAHTNFTQEMCKKTVINRACKQPINSSTDAVLLDDEYSNKSEDEVNQIKSDIKAETVVEEISFEEIPMNMKATDSPGEKVGAIQPDNSFEFVTE